jgi:hypothetical protein
VRYVPVGMKALFLCKNRVLISQTVEDEIKVSIGILFVSDRESEETIPIILQVLQRYQRCKNRVIGW